MKVSHFTKPDNKVKTCLVYFKGTFPPKRGFCVAKDLSLPTRLYPNAKFLIRCDTSEKVYEQNYKFFAELYKGHKFKLTTDKQTYEDLRVDVIFLIHYGFVFLGGRVDIYTADKEYMLENTKAKVHILFNEEVVKKIEGLHSYIQKRDPSFWDIYRNRQRLTRLKGKSDWSNVTLICNEDKFEQWVNDRPTEELQRTINISYLSDIILYDLPDKDTLKCSVSKSRHLKGVYIGNFSPTRVTWWNRYMTYRPEVSISVFGPHNEQLLNFTSDGRHIDNDKAISMMNSGKYHYSLYFGKGNKSLYLGATFYEPLLQGIPIFVWDGTDPEHKLFPKISECYFKNVDHLHQLLSFFNPEKLEELWTKQVTAIYSKNS